MTPAPPTSTSTDTLFPYTTLFRSALRSYSSLTGTEESRKCDRNGGADQMPGSHFRVFRAGVPLVTAQARLHWMRYRDNAENVIRVPVSDRKSTRLNSSH